MGNRAVGGRQPIVTDCQKRLPDPDHARMPLGSRSGLLFALFWSYFWLIKSSMRVIRLFFAGISLLWLCFAILKLIAAFHAPNAMDGAVAQAIGYLLMPLFLFCAFAFTGRESRRRQDRQKGSGSKDIVPPSTPE